MARQTAPSRVLPPIIGPPQRFDRAALARRALIGLDAFLGLTAVAGGLALLLGWIDPPLEWLSGSPFDDYLVPGLVLMIVVGGAGLVATVAVLRHDAAGVPASIAAGLLIIGYEVVEAAVIGLSVLQFVYAGVGLLIVALAVRLWTAGARDRRSG